MSRSLQHIPAGASVMVDANVLVYALNPQMHLHSPCRDLLERGTRGKIDLYTSVSVVAEVIHRAMVMEMVGTGLAQHAAEALRLLKQQPDVLIGLTRYRTLLRDLRQARIDILPQTYRDLYASRVYREQHGLMANDSLIVAVMRREHIPYLATNDPDFERVPGLAVRMPVVQVQ